MAEKVFSEGSPQLPEPVMTALILSCIAAYAHSYNQVVERYGHEAAWQIIVQLSNEERIDDACDTTGADPTTSTHTATDNTQ